MIGSVVATIDQREIDRGIAGLIRASKDLTPAWRESRRPALSDQKQHARATEGPDGKWAPRSAFTIARARTMARARGRKRAARMLGKLPTAVRVVITPNSIIIESIVRWSMAQAAGARVGHGAKLPARVWLWASSRLMETVAGIIAKRMGSAWKG